MYHEHNMNHSDCLLHDKKKSHQMSFHFLRLGGWLSLAAMIVQIPCGYIVV